MKRRRIYTKLVSFILLSLLLVSVAAAGRFDLHPPKLQMPRLLEPDNGENINLANPCEPLVFNWSKVRLIDHYAILIDYYDPDSNEWNYRYSEWTYTNSFAIAPSSASLNEGVLYRWSIAAVDYSHPISFSRTENNFTISTTLDSCPPP